MTFFEYLFILRRRWYYVAVGLLAGAVGGFLTAPGSVDGPVTYTARHTMLADITTASGAALNLEQSALLASTGPVPDRVAERLDEEGLPTRVRVRATADVVLRSLAITAISTSAEGAARAADLTAEEINAELSTADRALYDQQLSDIRDQVSSLSGELAGLDGQLAGLAQDDPARSDVEVRRAAVATSLSDAQAQFDTLESSGPPKPPLRTLEAATGSKVTTEGWQLPASRPARASILGMFGLLVGALGAVAADRLDTRVRGKEDAERAFDVPVIAEIPPMVGKSRENYVATRPASPFVEAHRALRTVVLFAAAEGAAQGASEPNGARGSNGHDTRNATVILVTSPAAGEGKTTTAAHLAAVLAEVGKRTLIISADFRRPRIHEYFGIPRQPGLSDVLESDGSGVRLSDLQMTTNFNGVHLLPSGSPVNNPAHLLRESAHLIAAARRLFDFIIIDTPPLLVANDATALATESDMVIMVAKADRTTRTAAQRATQVLRRIDAPLLGVAVVAAHDIETAYGYYRYRYYAETDEGANGKRWWGGRDRDERPVSAGVGSPSTPEE